MNATLALAAILAMGQTQQVDPNKTAMPKGLNLGSKLKADFNAAKGSVRLMFIFAPS